MADIETAKPIALLDEVRQLKALVTDVATGLKNQQELLKIRGMSLPPGTLQAIDAIQAQLAHLEASLVDDERELSQLRALVATSAMINSSLDIDGVLSAAMDEVINLTGAERGYILLKNSVTEELEFRITRSAATLEEAELQSQSDGSYQVSSTILNEVLTTGEAVLSDNAHKDPRMQNSETIAQFVLRSVLCVPLKYRDRIVGAVYVDNRFRVAVFTARELTLLKAFANQVAVAIENARLFANAQSSLAEITEMKELIENVFASIGSGVITTNATDCVTTYNKAASTILRRAPEDAIGESLQTVLPVLSEEFNEHLRAVREFNRSASVEAEPEVPGRGQIVLNMKLSPLKDANQQTQGVAMVLDDLTAERERQEALDLVRRYLPPGMMDNIHQIARLALGGERREVTTLFADVCPLGTFPRELRPPQIMELLNVYLSRATDAIHNANGLIDKYMGSEIMVLFNSQLNPQADHALQAVEAALELRRMLVELYETLNMNPAEHFYRVGIHTGIATLGNVGSSKRRNFTAIGDAINLSKRLQENSQSGQIIVSEDTVRAIEALGSVPDDINFVERGRIQVKGRQQQTPIYEVFRT
jgi:adenylate cyclase